MASKLIAALSQLTSMHKNGTITTDQYKKNVKIQVKKYSSERLKSYEIDTLLSTLKKMVIDGYVSESSYTKVSNHFLSNMTIDDSFIPEIKGHSEEVKRVDAVKDDISSPIVETCSDDCDDPIEFKPVHRVFARLTDIGVVSVFGVCAFAAVFNIFFRKLYVGNGSVDDMMVNVYCALISILLTSFFAFIYEVAFLVLVGGTPGKLCYGVVLDSCLDEEGFSAVQSAKRSMAVICTGFFLFLFQMGMLYPPSAKFVELMKTGCLSWDRNNDFICRYNKASLIGVLISVPFLALLLAVCIFIMFSAIKVSTASVVVAVVTIVSKSSRKDFIEDMSDKYGVEVYPDTGIVSRWRMWRLFFYKKNGLVSEGQFREMMEYARSGQSVLW